MANLRAMIEIEVVKNDHTYRMFVPQGVPYADAQEVCLEMHEVIREWEKQSKAVAEKKEESESVEPEVVGA